MVGRAAETRAPAGGLLLDRFGVPLPARPWSDEGVRFGRSVLHLGLTLEAGWLGYSGPDPEAAGSLLDHTPTQRAVSRLALGSVSPIPVGEHRIRYRVHAAVGYRHQLEGEMIHTVPRQLVEVRSRAHLAVDLARRVTLGVAAQYRRHLQRSRLGLDHRLEDYADARLRLRGWILPARLALRMAYRFALGYPEDPDDRLDRYRDHDLELGVDYRGGQRWGVGLTLQAGLGEHRMQRVSPDGWQDAGRRSVIPLRAIAHGFWRLGSRLVTTADLGFASA